jgi:hypothetical protein
MINTPEPTIKLTDEETTRIEKVKTTLLNLESEISIATKNLKAIKSDTDHAVKEKTYQNEQLDTLILKVEEKVLINSKLDEQIAQKTAMLNDLLSKFKEHSDLMTSEKVDHKKRENKLKQNEIEFSEKAQKIWSNELELIHRMEDFDKKVVKLKEVISTF